jgi:DNA-binding MarR family transcriptional regulator
MDRAAREEFIFGSILILSNKIQIWGDTILTDLTLKQWFLLVLISKMKAKNPTLNEISEISGTSRQNVKKMLEHLVENKYLKIHKSKSDARALSVSLLKKTYDYFEGMEKKGAEAINSLFAETTDEELRVTCGTLEKLLLFFGVQPLDEHKIMEKSNEK